MNTRIDTRGSRRQAWTDPRIGMAALAALALLLLLATAASAGERQWRVGVSDGNVDPGSDVDRMGAADVGVYRTQFNWERIERDTVVEGVCPGADGYEWSYYDSLVRRASREGVDLLPVITGSPDYVAADPRNPPDTSEAEIRNYRCFVEALVSRYGRGGELPGSSRAVRPLTDWQVWNEVNLKNYSVDRDVNPREYARLLALTSSELRSQDRRATIAVAGLPERPATGMRSGRFLTELYRVRRIERKFDVLALHPYARDHRGVEGAMIRMRRLLQRVNDPGRYVWITEVGWATGGRGGSHGFLTKSVREQARQLGKTLRMLHAERRRFNVGTVTWFRWRDTASSTSASQDPFDYAGLYRQDGSYKRSCEAFVRFTGGRCRTIPGAAVGSASSLLTPNGAPDARLPSLPE